MSWAGRFCDSVSDLQSVPSAAPPRAIVVPSSDRAFSEYVARIIAGGVTSPMSLQRRLRRIFPRVVVRERSLSSEPTTWYVYRDGGWRAPIVGDWWKDESLPRVAVSSDGWLIDATATAAGLMGFDPAHARDHHFSDFVVPGTLDDAVGLFELLDRGHELTATILMRPTTGDIIATELHASKVGEAVVGVFRLAADVEPQLESGEVARPASVTTVPSTDVAFRAYVLRAVERMPEPTPDGLLLRVHRVYPHAVVEPRGDDWIVERESQTGQRNPEWWHAQDLARVRFDRLAFILEANQAACDLLGHDLVGHHWQDFVTPGDSDETAVLIEILRAVGAAESRFRMPREDGTLVEFDTYTTVTGDELVTVMRSALTD